MAQPVFAHPGEQAASESGGEEILAPPPTYKANDVRVDEKLGAKVPTDARFRDQDGKDVTLGEVLAGELPTILTFNYSDCPMLCSVQLNGLTAVLPAIADKQAGVANGDALFRIGTQFRIVTIDLEPNESLDKLAKLKARYIDRVTSSAAYSAAGDTQRAAARAGWTFLVAERPGDGAAIRRVAESVGFSYTYIADRAEWAHPAALIFLSVKGTVTRYVYGVEFDPAVMRESIIKAGTSEPATAVGFMNRCYHFDPDASNHSRAGVMALRIGAAGFVVLLLSALGVMHVIRRSSSRDTPRAQNGAGRIHSDPRGQRGVHRA
jgi:protein SCO1/2